MPIVAWHLNQRIIIFQISSYRQRAATPSAFMLQNPTRRAACCCSTSSPAASVAVAASAAGRLEGVPESPLRPEVGEQRDLLHAGLRRLSIFSMLGSLRRWAIFSLLGWPCVHLVRLFQPADATSERPLEREGCWHANCALRLEPRCLMFDGIIGRRRRWIFASCDIQSCSSICMLC